MSKFNIIKISPIVGKLYISIVISVMLSITMHGCNSADHSNSKSYRTDVYDVGEISRETFSVNSPSLLFVSKDLLSQELEQNYLPGFVAEDWEFSRNDNILGVGRFYDYPILQSLLIIEQRERITESSGKTHVHGDIYQYSRIVR